MHSVHLVDEPLKRKMNLILLTFLWDLSDLMPKIFFLNHLYSPQPVPKQPLMWFVHFIMWTPWLERLCQEHKMQIQIKYIQKTKPAKRHHDTHNVFLVLFWALTGQKGNYEESGSSVFSYWEAFQHLYLLLLGDIPANVYGLPQSDGNPANSVQPSTGIITVTFCALKSHDYERGIRAGKRKVNLMPKGKRNTWKMSCSKDLFPPHLCSNCVYWFC